MPITNLRCPGQWLVRTISLCLAVFLLSGCNVRENLASRDTTLVPGEQSAIVVAGLARTAAPINRADTYLVMGWRRFDPVNGKFDKIYNNLLGSRITMQASKQLNPNVDSLITGVKPTEPQTTPKYFVFKVDAGSYAFDFVETMAYLSNRVTSQTPNSQDSSLVNPRAGRFSVAPGEIVYIGDYYFDTAKFPIQLNRIGLDVSAAQAALKEYPGVQAAMAVRMPTTGDR